MAIQTVRQAESIKQQQPLLRSSNGIPDTSVAAVQKRKFKQRSGAQKKDGKDSAAHGKETGTTCSRCGRNPAHDRQHCSAKDAECRKCKKKRHFQVVCRSAAKVGGVHTQDQRHEEDIRAKDEEDIYDAFLGAVDSSSEDNPWAVTLEVNGNPIKFCIDRCGGHSHLKEAHRKAGYSPLVPPDQKL